MPIHRGVLMLDDDIIMPCADIERGFAAWRHRPERITGFYSRLLEGDPPQYQCITVGESLEPLWCVGDDTWQADHKWVEVALLLYRAVRATRTTRECTTSSWLVPPSWTGSSYSRPTSLMPMFRCGRSDVSCDRSKVRCGRSEKRTEWGNDTHEKKLSGDNAATELTSAFLPTAGAGLCGPSVQLR